MLSRIQWRRVFRFLACVFFVSTAFFLYLYLADVSVPSFLTGISLTLEANRLRIIVHAVVSIICFYLGFVRKGTKFDSV